MGRGGETSEVTILHLRYSLRLCSRAGLRWLYHLLRFLVAVWLCGRHMPLRLMAGAFQGLTTQNCGEGCPGSRTLAPLSIIGVPIVSSPWGVLWPWLSHALY